VLLCSNALNERPHHFRSGHGGHNCRLISDSYFGEHRNSCPGRRTPRLLSPMRSGGARLDALIVDEIRRRNWPPRLIPGASFFFGPAAPRRLRIMQPRISPAELVYGYGAQLASTITTSEVNQ
jgi:hypothetical protein